MYDPSFKIWGYETNWGSFAQFTRVQAHQCMPKAKHLTWEEAAGPTLVGATAYRMLMGWPPHTVRPNDVVLIWGASGGLGCMAIQIVKAEGGIPVGIVSDDKKIDFCMKLGAKGVINRKKFFHWGMMPHWKDTEEYNKWAAESRAFGKAIWDVVGERRSPRIVFEHPGEHTIPTSVFVCDTGGMVVICAGHHRIQRGRRFALPVDAAEAPARIAFRQRRAVLRVQSAGRRRARSIRASRRRSASIRSPNAIRSCMRTARPRGKWSRLVGAPKAGMKDLRTLSISLGFAAGLKRSKTSSLFFSCLIRRNSRNHSPDCVACRYTIAN